MTALVGVDVGTTGVKALALSHEGAVLAQAERGYPLSSPRAGWSEQDPEQWVEASREALDALAVRPTCLGFTGQMHGLVCLDSRDRVVRPADHGADPSSRRAREQRDRLAPFRPTTRPPVLWLGPARCT